MSEQWVMEVLVELIEHREMHPTYWQHSVITGEYVRPERCGCEALKHVPDDVVRQAEAVHSDRLARSAS